MDYCSRKVGFRVDEERRTIQVIWWGPEDTWIGIGEPRPYPLRPDEVPEDRFRPRELWNLAWVTLKAEHPEVYRKLLKVVKPVRSGA